MIKVFNKIETDLSGNGEIVLKPTKASLHKEDNGDYYLDLECLNDSTPYYFLDEERPMTALDWFTEGTIVSANTPQGYQAFRMTNVRKTKTKVSCRCWHIFYDSENYVIRAQTS